MIRQVRSLFKCWLKLSFFCLVVLLIQGNVNAQNNSVARDWNELLLDAIRNDLARPTVHARNLFHLSVVKYDAWAAYEPTAEPYFLGQLRHGFYVPFDGVSIPNDAEAAREEAISFAAYRLLTHRFQNSPGRASSLNSFENYMLSRGYDVSNTSEQYVDGGAAELGNYIAARMIEYGLQDGSNEANDYGNQHYITVNDPIEVEKPGNPNIKDPNRWQPITLTESIDQAGNPVGTTPSHLSPEWGNTDPFALHDSNATFHTRGGNQYKVFYDPGDPPYLDTNATTASENELYSWNFKLVSVWQSHLDPSDSVMWDVSPASIGNIQSYPESIEGYEEFYKLIEGGTTADKGYNLNPVTNQPYAPQIVPRGDYTRILAEFWADGLDSETPPGHWFEILHEVTDHPMFEKKWMGTGQELNDLEYDVKSYLTLGGAMHDAAVTAWSIKGWYDYVRPVSAIRYMADKGQSSDNNRSDYHPAGIPLIPGYIEIVGENDSLAGPNQEHAGKIKLYTWKGPDYINDPETDAAGVGWIIAENWWPYQRPSFVTPPFAGYISGHSTFSRTAAEVMTLMTGSPYFPGGMSNFHFEKNNYLEFEQGPSQDIYLQWATYRDASDWCSLSRIWGGIHPPADDIHGRLIGIELGHNAFDVANEVIQSINPAVHSVSADKKSINLNNVGDTVNVEVAFDTDMNTSVDPSVRYFGDDPLANSLDLLNSTWLDQQTYKITYKIKNGEEILNDIYLQIDSAESVEGHKQNIWIEERPFLINTVIPEIVSVSVSHTLINNSHTDTFFTISIEISEDCDTTIVPGIQFLSDGNPDGTLNYIPAYSGWVNKGKFLAVYEVVDLQETIEDISLAIGQVQDKAGNEISIFESDPLFSIDMLPPGLVSHEVSKQILNRSDIGSRALTITLSFDKFMDTTIVPVLTFPDDDPLNYSLSQNYSHSFWIDELTCQITYNLLNSSEILTNISVNISEITDLPGNTPVPESIPDLFSINTVRPEVSQAKPGSDYISTLNTGDEYFEVMIKYTEQMDTSQLPVAKLKSDVDTSDNVYYNPWKSEWLDLATYIARFSVEDNGAEVEGLGLKVFHGKDKAGNMQQEYELQGFIDLDTRRPEIASITANTYHISDETDFLKLVTIFDEAMNTAQAPEYTFLPEGGLDAVLKSEAMETMWLNKHTHQKVYKIVQSNFREEHIDLKITGATDLAGNPNIEELYEDMFSAIVTTTDDTYFRNDYRANLYPNPVVSGRSVTIHTGYERLLKKVSIYTLAGQKVYHEEISIHSDNGYKIDLPMLKPGVYTVNALYNAQSLHFKLIVIE